MPQMAPMNWLSLFLMFSLIYLIFCMTNYFNYQIYPSFTNKIFNNTNKKLIWKW